MSRSSFVKLPPPPYYCVVFSSLRRPGDEGYACMAQRMDELAAQQPGFLGQEGARGEDGFGITVSYWSSPQAIANWKQHAEHRIAQETGKLTWYEHYELRIARVERAYAKAHQAGHA